MQTKQMKKALLLLQQGQERGFDIIYATTHKLLYSVAFSYVKDTALAKDIVQDTYLQFLNHLNQVNPALSLSNYLITIAKNLSLNLLKKRSKEKSEDFLENDWQYPDLQSEMNLDFDTPILDIAKHHLNEEELQILLLLAVSGYKRKEVADLLEQPLSTITWKYQKILKTMQELLIKEGIV